MTTRSTRDPGAARREIAAAAGEPWTEGLDKEFTRLKQAGKLVPAGPRAPGRPERLRVP